MSPRRRDMKSNEIDTIGSVETSKLVEEADKMAISSTTPVGSAMEVEGARTPGATDVGMGNFGSLGYR